MTVEDRVQAVVHFGLTERQARFLVLVMHHAGVCVARQYATFAGIANGGDKCDAFFDKLIQRGCAVSCARVHNRARIFHLHHKPLYRAIGEPESRYRRPVSARHAVERLMLLDAVLASPDLVWLTTESHKAGYLAVVRELRAIAHTRRTGLDAARQTVREQLPDWPRRDWSSGAFLSRHDALGR